MYVTGSTAAPMPFSRDAQGIQRQNTALWQQQQWQQQQGARNPQANEAQTSQTQQQQPQQHADEFPADFYRMLEGQQPAAYPVSAPVEDFPEMGMFPQFSE